MRDAATVAGIGDALHEFGLITRGGFNSDDKSLPVGSNGKSARAIVLVGIAGSSFWPVFHSSPEFSDGDDNPLDRWSRRIGQRVAERLDASCVFPFDGPPYPPFLSWAARAESLHRSKLGMSMHPEYGLWHSYRFALLFSHPLPDVIVEPVGPDICAACNTQPCLRACPVDAFSERGYDIAACCGFLREHPDAECNTAGCLARRACPEGTGYGYTSEHAAFHMTAFVKAQSDRFDDNQR